VQGGGDLSDSQRQVDAARRYGDVMSQKFAKLEITPSGAAEASRSAQSSLLSTLSWLVVVRGFIRSRWLGGVTVSKQLDPRFAAGRHTTAPISDTMSSPCSP